MGTVNSLGGGHHGSSAGCAHRLQGGRAESLPASFFVSVAYDCGRSTAGWCSTRNRARSSAGLSRSVHARDPDGRQAGSENRPRSGVRAPSPRSRCAPCAWRAWSCCRAGPTPAGTPCTITDVARTPVDLRGGVIYHCGPVVAKDGDGWRVTAAGHDGIREEPYQADIIKRYGGRASSARGAWAPGPFRAEGSGAPCTSTPSGALRSSTRGHHEGPRGVLMEFGTPEAILAPGTAGLSGDRPWSPRRSLHAESRRPPRPSWRRSAPDWGPSLGPGAPGRIIRGVFESSTEEPK